MRKHWLVLFVLSALVLTSMGATAKASPGTIRGYVFRDTNQNGAFDAGEERIPGVFVTVSFGDYQHTYYTGEGDPAGSVPGPGSYGPTPIPTGDWKVTVHVPDNYRSTTPSELVVFVPEASAATGVNFGLFGSGPIQYSAGTGVGIGGGAGSSTLPSTGGIAQATQGQLIALLVALIGFLVLLGTPWCVARTKRVYKRWW
jgi:hypothetical protein